MIHLLTRYTTILLLLYLPFEAGAQSVKIGDVLQHRDGSKGIVFWLHEDGSGGWMAAMEDLPESYSWGNRTPDIQKFFSAIEAVADTAGFHHTAALLATCNDDPRYFTHAIDFRNGWYLPAIGQLVKLRAALPIINQSLITNGGAPFSETGYLSSSSQAEDQDWMLRFNDGYVDWMPRTIPFKIRPIYSFSTKASAQTQLSYHWNTGESVPLLTPSPTQTKEYTVTVTSTTGCYARASQQIFVASGVDDTVRATIRRGEVYYKNGFKESEPGIYTHTLNGANGCSSTVILYLNVLEPINTEFSDSFCEGSPYQKYNFTQWDTGTYTQRWTAANGCDSIVTLHLTAHPSYHKTYKATLFFGGTYTEHGFNVSTPGIHHLHLQTVNGCDSIFTVDITMLSNSQTTINASLCEGETYTEHGFNASTTGTYFQHLQNATGLDSTVVLHLTVNPTYQTTYDGALCPGKTYTQHGFNISVPGVYHRHLQSATGCDSIITLNLITAPIYNEVIDATICEGEAYTQNGFNETQAGTHYLRLHSASGCDSIFTLNLTVDPSYYFEKSATVCQGESYDFKGMVLHETGTYYHNLQTVTGCDSIYELNLTVKPAFSKFIDTRICEGTSYTEYGFNVSAPGIHIRRAASNNGCDSVFTLQLEIESIKGTVSSELLDCATHKYGFTFDNQTDTPVTGYTWDFGDGTVSPEQAPTHNYAKEGNYPVKLTVTTDNRCETTSSHPIDVPYYVNPMPIYSSRKGINNEDGLIIFRTDLIEGLAYQWDLGDGTSADTYKVEHRYNTEGREYYQVRLTVNNSDDCLMEQKFQLKTFKIIYPPNTFSPNGDGINDLFMKGYRLQILNRNGAVIFKGEDGWDGTRKGEQATEDTYFYEVHYLTEEGEKNKTGYITLIR